LACAAVVAKTLVSAASIHFAAGTGAEDKLYAGHGGKPVMVVLMGLRGSGKSTFTEAVIAGSAAGRPWVHICQVDPLPLSSFPFISLLIESVLRDVQ
jgi:putative protein kinase ArgK-like GTPase of G3E family